MSPAFLLAYFPNLIPSLPMVVGRTINFAPPRRGEGVVEEPSLKNSPERHTDPLLGSAPLSPETSAIRDVYKLATILKYIWETLAIKSTTVLYAMYSQGWG